MLTVEFCNISLWEFRHVLNHWVFISSLTVVFYWCYIVNVLPHAVSARLSIISFSVQFQHCKTLFDNNMRLTVSLSFRLKLFISSINCFSIFPVFLLFFFLFPVSLVGQREKAWILNSVLRKTNDNQIEIEHEIHVNTCYTGDNMAIIMKVVIIIIIIMTIVKKCQKFFRLIQLLVWKIFCTCTISQFKS